MESYFITGGNPLAGEVEISGSGNSALGILAAAIMCDETVTVRNLPDVENTNGYLDAIKSIGAEVHYPDSADRHTVTVNGGNIHTLRADNDCIRGIVAPHYLIGALLGKYKEASVLFPGLRYIGMRLIEQHLKGLRALGAEISVNGDMVIAKADELTGGHISLTAVDRDKVTINMMLAASMAKGETMIENAAMDPHVVDVALFLNQMGADIRGAGTDRICITGVERFKATDYEIMPDQIEAGIFMRAAVATRGDVTIKRVIPDHLEAVSCKLRELGARIEESEKHDAVRITAPGCLNPASLFEYTEFEYTDEMKKERTGNLSEAAAFVIAGLAAEGITCVEGIRYIHKNFENFEGKIRSLGGIIEKRELND